MFRRHRELPRSTTKGQGSSPAWISNHTPLGSCVDFPRSSAAPKKKTPRPLIVALAKASSKLADLMLKTFFLASAMFALPE